jgi:hypothetical protein
MLTVVHEGATVSMHVLVLSTKTKKKSLGGSALWKSLSSQRVQALTKLMGLFPPCRNAPTLVLSIIPGDTGEIIVGSHLKILGEPVWFDHGNRVRYAH